MKNEKYVDERVLNEKRKIGNDAFNIIWIGLIISVIVQQYLYHAPFSQYAVEFILFFSISFYVVIRNIIIGNDLFNTKKSGQSVVILNSLVCGGTITVINTIQNYIQYKDSISLPIYLNTALVAGITFLSATLTAFIPMELLYLANKKRQKSLESKFDDDQE